MRKASALTPFLMKPESERAADSNEKVRCTNEDQRKGQRHVKHGDEV
jgi:hypothetical protein